MKNEDLLRELIDAAHDSGYDAAVMEKAEEWGKEFDVSDLLSEDARVGWQRHLEEAVSCREALRVQVLERMGIGGVIEFMDETVTVAQLVEEFEERMASRMTPEEDEGAQEVSIAMQFPWGFCPVCGEPVKVDMEGLQEHAHEAWETVLEGALAKAHAIRGGANDDDLWGIAAQQGVPLWCVQCEEPIEDLWLATKQRWKSREKQDQD